MIGPAMRRYADDKRPSRSLQVPRGLGWSAFKITLDDLAADLRDQFGTVTDAEIRADFAATMSAVADVQEGQRKLIRWLAKYNGVRRVFLEGLTDTNKPAFDAIVSEGT